jgi:hypothetical protein
MKPNKMTTQSMFIRNSISRPPLRRGLPRKQQLPRTQAMWIIRDFLFTALALAAFALSPAAQAVDPPPDGGYLNGNTAEGTDALFNLTDGVFNTAIGYNALYTNNGNYNTATGNAALSVNTTGYYNVADGSLALSYNSTGYANTADGNAALQQNVTGFNNTASGTYSLTLNHTGNNNIADRMRCLYNHSRQ